MDDALRMCCSQRVCDLRRIADALFNRNLSPFQSGCESFTLDQFHNEIIGSQVIERANVRMIQRRNSKRFTVKAIIKMLAAGLDRDRAAQTCIDGSKYFAHSPSA